MQITFTFSRRNVSLQWIKEETRGFDLPCSPHHFNGCQNNGQHHSRSIHHSRSYITPGATSHQKQHQSRNDITPGATSFQKQHYSRSKIFPTVPHLFSSSITSSIIVTPAEANTPAVNVTAAFPIKEAMTITLRSPFISVGLTNTAVLSMQLPPTLRRYSSPWWILSTWSPKLHHTNYARRSIIHQTPMQQSAPLPISHLSGLHHLRSARHISTFFMIVKPILHLRGQNKIARPHKHSAPWTYTNIIPVKLPRSFYHAFRIASIFQPRPSPPPFCLILIMSQHEWS